MAQNEWHRTTRLIAHAAAILEEQHPMTIRQLFYQLVIREILPNTNASYKLVIRVMTKARKDERCSFDDIVDRSRPEYSPNVFEDAAEYASAVERDYRKDYWATQPNHVEIWTEKDAIIGSIRDLTDELGVTVRVGRGYFSTTRAHEIAERFARIEKPITVFYLGDHDASGEDMDKDVYRRIRAFGSPPFRMKRLAIFARDIALFRLPPQQVKLTDSRAKEFKRKHGNRCVELDALPPNELRRRIRAAVEALRDESLWARAVAVEKVELASIRDIARMWPGDPQ